MLWFLFLAPCSTFAGVACAEAPAHLTFVGTPDLTFTLNGTPFDLPGGRRVLVTPPLRPDHRYVYEMTILRRGVLLARPTLEVSAGQMLLVKLADYLADAEPVNFGIQADRLAPPAGVTELLTVNGQPITHHHARELIAPAANLPDHRHRRWLTVIGPAAARAAVLARLRGDLAPLVADFVIKDYDPGDWAVARVGFRTDGQPTIYAQEPDGRVLFRLDGPDDLESNLQALRRPRPDYRSEDDPRRLSSSPSTGEGVLAVCLVLAALLLLLSRTRRLST